MAAKKKTAKKAAKRAAKKSAPKAPAEGFSAAFAEGGVSGLNKLRGVQRRELRPKPLTPEQQEAERAKGQSILVARASVIEATAGKHGVRGHRNCIVCGKGDLEYRVDDDGQVAVRCSTPGCVSDGDPS
jgi:hypothetical protein